MHENVTDGKIKSAQNVMLCFLGAYLFLLLFPHTSTLKEISFWGAFISWVLIRSKRESFVPLNYITAPLLAYLCIGLVSSALSIGPLESIKDFKGETFISILLFLIIATEVEGEGQIKKLLAALVISLTVYTSLTFVETAEKGLACLWGGDTGAEYPWKMESSLFFPATLGLLLLTQNKLYKFLLAALAFIAIMLIALDKQIIVFLGAIPIVLLWLIFARPKKSRIWMAASVVLFIIVFGMLFTMLKDNPAMDEFKNKSERMMNASEEFKGAGGLSNRMGLWQAAVDLIKEKPVLGYGGSIQKFITLTQREDFLKMWKDEKPDVYALITSEKKLPHNIFLDIGIQSGVLGIVSFSIFLLAYMYTITAYALRIRSDATINFLVIFIWGTIALFMATNLLNSELSSASGKLFFAMLGTGGAWVRDE